MSEKQEIWLTEYLKTFNATEAARAAGYKWPNKYGAQLKEKLQGQIDSHLQKKVMSRDEALARLADIARFDVSDYITDYGRTKGLDIEKMKADGHGHLIRSVKHTNSGTTIEWADPSSALALVLKETHPTGHEDDPQHVNIEIKYADADPDPS
jgi:hypothetical protein